MGRKKQNKEAVAVDNAVQPPAQDAGSMPAKPGYFAFLREVDRTEIQSRKRESVVALLGTDAEAIKLVPPAPLDRAVAARVLADVAGRLRGKGLQLRKQVTSKEKLVHALLRIADDMGPGGTEAATEVALLVWTPGNGLYCGNGDGKHEIIAGAVAQYDAAVGLLSADDWAQQVRAVMRAVDGFKARRDGRVYWTPEYSHSTLVSLNHAVRAAGADLVIAKCDSDTQATAIAADGLADQIAELVGYPGGIEVLEEGRNEVVARAARLSIVLSEDALEHIAVIDKKIADKREKSSKTAERKAAAKARQEKIDAVGTVAAPAVSAAPAPAAAPAAAAIPAPPAPAVPTPAGLPVPPAPPVPTIMLSRAGAAAPLALVYDGEAAGGMHAYSVQGGGESPVFDWEPNGEGHACGYAGRIYSTVKL